MKLKTRRNTPARKNGKTHPGANGRSPTFGVRTRIARAAGKSGRYASDSIRALPARDGEHVVLQATDGHQAVCVFSPGTAAGSELVPAQVLPTRQLSDFAMVKRVNGTWQSSEGKLGDAVPGANGNFPPIGDVLPAVGRTPAHETVARAERRRKSRGQEMYEHVVLGIDIDLLRRQAEALGTSKLVLFVPLPVRPPGTTAGSKSRDVHVNRPVALCPATDEGVDGIGVVMPLAPAAGKTNTHYEKLRRQVVEAEKRAKPTPAGK